MRITFFLFVYCIWSVALLADPHLPDESRIVRINSAQQEHQPSHDYFVGLIKAALHNKNYELVIADGPNEGRAFKLLATGEYFDLLWSAASPERDEDHIKIDIPLFKGGLGIRGAVIRRDFEEQYAKTSTFIKFKSYVSCQGSHWPDADIFESSQLPVIRVVQFKSMLEMVDKGRCDLLPLSIFEGAAELAAWNQAYPHLVFSTDTLIRYKLTMHFYVNSARPELASNLRNGLISMMESGEFVAYMQNHHLTENAFPLNQYSASNIITLNMGHQIGDDWIFSMGID
ncbi:MAG: hypothetical protein ACFHVJ_09430 [Aestuariibacter sp.]